MTKLRRRTRGLRGPHNGGLVFSVCVEASLVALAVLLSDTPGHGSGDHSADDGGDDRPGSTRVAEAARRAKAAGDYDTRKPGDA